MVELGETPKFTTCNRLVNSHNCSDILIKLLIFFYSKDAPIIQNRNAKGPRHVFILPILWLHNLATFVGIKDRICDSEHNVLSLYSWSPSQDFFSFPIPFLPNIITKVLPCPWERSSNPLVSHIYIIAGLTDFLKMSKALSFRRT